jgi:hypothetical protein
MNGQPHYAGKNIEECGKELPSKLMKLRKETHHGAACGGALRFV